MYRCFFKVFCSNSYAAQQQLTLPHIPERIFMVLDCVVQRSSYKSCPACDTLQRRGQVNPELDPNSH
ncbi:MAG: hypothetical protein NZL95_01735 [Chitinophagales bacterium]|nr:hypothetical protein [Chitinophagales bacterium]MDW8427257.1 hypothetical protein [Chitinophagales bacterium]